MKFAIMSKSKDIKRIVDILAMFDIDIDSKTPDFVIAHGGDGTILRAERKYPGVPKITIRASEGGFKCKYIEHDLEDILIRIDSGAYEIKEEAKLETTFEGKKYLSLNEVQVHNMSPIKAIRFSIYMNSLPLFENIVGDGAVIATPFGSSGYFSSIGGEMFDNGIGIGLNNPFNAKSKPIIVDGGFSPEIYIRIIRDNGLLLFDNDENMVNIEEGDEIKVETSKNTAKFVM
jgi:NAD+ kinase